MEEQRDEIEFVDDVRAPSMLEAGQGLSLSSQTETLDGDVDVTHNEACIEVANTVEVSDGGVATCDGSLKQEKADFGTVEDVVASVSGEESTEKIIISCDDVEKIDAITEAAAQRDVLECEGNSGTVEVKSVDEIGGSEHCNDTVELVEFEIKDETPLSEVKSKDGASHESVGEEEIVTSTGNEVTVEDHDGALDSEQNVQTEKSRGSSVGAEMFSVAEKKADLEKEATKTSEEDSNKMDVDCKQEGEDKVGVSYNEQGNSGCTTSDADQEKESAKKSEEDNNIMDIDDKQAKEKYETTDAKHSESAQDTEESIHLSKGVTNKENIETVSEVKSDAEISHVEEKSNVNQKEEFGEAMEIEYAAEGQVEKDVTVGDDLDNAGNGSAVESMVQTQDVPIAEADRNEPDAGNVMETDERKDIAMVSDLTGTVESADSANPNSHAAPGEVEPLDHNALFDPVSDITNFIDFSGVSSWSGNIQDLKTETGNLSLKEDKKATDMADEVAKVDNDVLKSVDATANATSHDNLSAEGIHNESSEACVAFEAEASAAATDCPKEALDPVLGSEENQDNDHDCLDEKTADQQDTVREEDDITYETPSSDPTQKEDTEMEENPNTFDYGDDETYCDIKTNGVKRKADVLNEDQGEGIKTVSLAKVSFAERPSFKIGACIARAASQMAGSPSVLKGSNFGDETLSVESFVSQLHCAATDPVNENGVSDIAVGFFLDFRNSLASQHVTPENVNSKRVKTSNPNARGTETFEFQEMDDTYWTDRMIHNGCEEQTPPTEKGNYEIVPVELKPAQVQRTRRPYRRRQSQINVPLPASEKPMSFDENAPAELIMKFSESDTIPPETSLSKMFKRFGPIRESQTEVDSENNRARVVFKKGADAKVAYNSAGRFNIFGTKTVNYELSHTITETFKVKPYVVCLGEENAALYLPS